jgi:hypothetical protein
MHHLKKLEEEVSPHTLREEPILSLSDFHGSRTFLVVVRHVVDPSADGIAPHQAGVVGLRQFGRRTRILHPQQGFESFSEFIVLQCIC